MKHKTYKFMTISLIIIAAAVLALAIAPGKESIVYSQWSIENEILSTIDNGPLTSFLRPLAVRERSGRLGIDFLAPSTMGDGIDRPMRNVDFSFIPPIPGSGLEEFKGILINIDALHAVIARPIYHPVVIQVDLLPLELQNILRNIPINLHGSRIMAYDFLRSCVDEIIFTPFIEVIFDDGNKIYAAACIVEDYVDTKFRPGKRIIAVNVLHPAKILADAYKKPIKVLPQNMRDVNELFHQIIHEAAHKYVQRLVKEGFLDNMYENNESWFEKIATTIQRQALMNLCVVLEEKFGSVPGVYALIESTNRVRGEREERIKICNRNLGLKEDDYSLPAVLDNPIPLPQLNRVLGTVSKGAASQPEASI